MCEVVLEHTRTAPTVLRIGNFTLALSDGEFGDRSTGAMPPGAAFVALIEYRRKPASNPDVGCSPPDAFRGSSTRHSSRQRGSASAARASRRTAFLHCRRRPFYLYVVLAGPRTARRRQLAAIDHALKSLLSTTRCEKL
jgi:hypothetical protein